MQQRDKVLTRRARPTTKSYRAAVKAVVLDLQATHDLNDPELAARLGCSSGTVKNARNMAGNLDGVTLLNIEHEFGPSALDPVLALGGSRCVPIDAGEGARSDACLALLEALRVIIETKSPDSDGGTDTTAKEAAAILVEMRSARRTLDALIALGESGIAQVAA